MKKHKKNWKYYTGITLIYFSLLLPLLGLLLPLLNLSPTLTAILVGSLTVGGPEICIILATLFLGKKHILYFKSKIRGFFRKKRKMPKPVSKKRYYFGLTILLASGIPLYLNAYFPEVFPEDEQKRLLIFIFTDLAFVLSFFILGANFWEKFKRLFIWEKEST